MAPIKPEDCKNMDEVRTEIDRLDTALVTLIGERFGYVDRAWQLTMEKIDALLLLRAFEDGADAVYVAGCALGDCHFIEGNVRGKAAVRFTKKLLEEAGFAKGSVRFGMEKNK